MVRKSLIFALLVCALDGFGIARAQQAESVAPGQPLPPQVRLFQGLEDKWSVAIVNKDQYTMELLLSPLYVGISSVGDVRTRNQQISDMFDKAMVPISLQQRVVSVRTFGDTAVVSGTYDAKWRTDGPDREERGVFTNIFVQSQARWECVNAQRTPVIDVTPGSGKKRKSKEKKSDAANPFHNLFFHKGANATQPNTAQDAALPKN